MSRLDFSEATTPIGAIAAIFADRAYPSATEAELQEAIAAALTEAGLAFEREARLSDEDRIDFLVGDVGIEVKTQGGKSAVIRQLHRYAQHERIRTLVLATTRYAHASLPAILSGKPVAVVHVHGGAF